MSIDEITHNYHQCFWHLRPYLADADTSFPHPAAHEAAALMAFGFFTPYVESSGLTKDAD